MSFWDKVNEVAKTVTDKTNDMIEKGKLSAKVSSLQKDIDAKALIIGDYYLALFDAGIPQPEELQQVYADINDLRDELASLNAQIEALNEQAAVSAAEERVCPACGKPVKSGAFCPACGAKIDA